MDGAAVGAAVVIKTGADGQFDQTVAVEVADVCDGATEVVEVIQCSREVPLGVADLLVRLDRPVGVQEQHVHRSAVVVSTVVIPIGTDDQIGDTVSIKVAHVRHRSAEVIVVVERGCEVPLGVADRLVRLHRAIRVQEQNMHGTAVVTAVLVPRGTDSEVRDAVAVQVSEVCQ